MSPQRRDLAPAGSFVCGKQKLSDKKGPGAGGQGPADLKSAPAASSTSPAANPGQQAVPVATSTPPAAGPLGARCSAGAIRTCRLALCSACLVLAGCGYIAGPLPPLANVPARVADLVAVQRGGNIIAQFTIPAETTENMPVKEPLTLDLRAGAAAQPFRPEEWAAHAQRIAPPAQAKGIAHYGIPSAPWTGKDVVIGVRTVGGNGKASDWSNFVTLHAVPPLEQPQGVRGESTPDGVRLTWSGRGNHFRVLRKGPGEQQYNVVGADLQQPEFLDTTAAIGTEYSYLVQAYEPQGDNHEAQSDLSAEAKVTRQAPLPGKPAGLLAVPTPSSIELSWDGNTDAQTTGYRVYRAEGSGEFARIGEVGAIPTYSDHQVQHGKAYRYALAALDKDGREGPRSAVVEVTLP